MMVRDEIVSPDSNRVKYFVRFIYKGSNGYRFDIGDLAEAIVAAHEVLLEHQHVGPGCRAVVVMEYPLPDNAPFWGEVEVYSTLKIWRNINPIGWDFWAGVRGE